MTAQQLIELHDFETSLHFDDRERLVIRFAAALTRNPADISDELFSALQHEFNDRQLIELAAVITWENARARFNRVFDIQAEGFSADHVCALPER